MDDIPGGGKETTTTDDSPSTEKQPPVKLFSSNDPDVHNVLYDRRHDESQETKQYESDGVHLSDERCLDDMGICPQCKRLNQRHTYSQQLHCAYKYACENGNHDLSRYRVMIVGQFGVGKTSIKRNLLNQKFLKSHIPTQGISLGNDCYVDVADGVDWKRGKPSFKELLHTILPRDVDWARNELNRGFKQRVIDLFLLAIGYGKSEGPDDTESLGNHLPPTVVDRVKDVIDGDKGQDKQGPHFSLWDFGGQRGYYILHQLFLNKQATYLLVMDGTKDLDSVVEPFNVDDTRDRVAMPKPTSLPQTARDFLDFWLKSIYSLVERCADCEAQPKVIIVVAKADKMSELRKVAYKESLQSHLWGKPYYDIVLCDPILVDNTNNKDPGIKQLKSWLMKVSQHSDHGHLSSLGSKYPTRWLVLLELIRQRRGEWKQHSIINFEEFLRLAKDTTYEENDAKEFLKRHHAFGDVLYFEEEHLDDMIITDPQWLIKAISPIFKPDTLKGTPDLPNRVIHRLEKHGELRESLLTKLWAGHARSVTMSELVKLLLMFELIVPFHDAEDGQKMYIVPSLLKLVEPTHVKVSDVAPSIGFTFYTDETKDEPCIPLGLFPRLVSRCWASDSHWELVGNPAFDYVQFRTHSSAEKTETILIALHLVKSSIRIIAHKVKYAEGEEEEVKTPDTEGNLHRDEVLATANALVQENLRSVIQRVFPRLQNQLKTLIWCGCVRTDESQAAPIEVGARGEKLRRHNFDHLLCHKHTLNFSVQAYRHWFAKPRTQPRLPVSQALQTLQQYKSATCGLIPKNRGRVLVVNNVNFKATDSSLKLQDRYGSESDAINLQKVFRELGFAVVIRQDQTAAQIRNFIQQEIRRPEHKEADAYVMWILSHGTAGSVYGTDGRKVRIERDIIHPFTSASCNSLFSKPKVFFFQRCHGHETTQEAAVGLKLEGESQIRDKGNGKERVSQPSMAVGECSEQREPLRLAEPMHAADNVLLVQVNISENESYRHTDKGSRLVREFVLEACRSGPEKELREILADVDDSLRRRRHGNDTIQSLDVESRSFEKFYFFPDLQAAISERCYLPVSA